MDSVVVPVHTDLSLWFLCLTCSHAHSPTERTRRPTCFVAVITANFISFVFAFRRPRLLDSLWLCCCELDEIRTCFRWTTKQKFAKIVSCCSGRIAIFHITPHLHSTPPPLQGPHRNIAIKFGTEKTTVVWLDSGKSLRFSRFNRRTRTWQTDGQTPHDSIGHASIASRGKTSTAKTSGALQRHKHVNAAVFCRAER